MSLRTAPFAVAAGLQAGSIQQATGAVAIGLGAGATGQKTFAVSAGYQAGFANQGTGSVSVGWQSGMTGQGAYSIALGPLAGSSNQPAGSIVLNASSSQLNPAASGLYINPINLTSNNVLPTLTIDAATSQIVQRPVGYTATRLTVYPMEIVTPTMNAATTAGVGGNYTASANSEYFDGNYAAWRAFDRNSGTSWATNGVSTNFWNRIQMPTTRNVAFMAFWGRATNTECANTFRIEGSNDGTYWTAITSTLTYGSAYNRIYAAAFIPSGSRNFLNYRFFGFNSQGGSNPGFSEWRLFAPSTTAYPNSVNAIRYVPQGGYNDFNNGTLYGVWGFSFTSRGGYVEVQATINYYSSSSSLCRMYMYIDGSYASSSNTAATEMYLDNSQWQTTPTLWWGGVLPAGDHTILIDAAPPTLTDTGQSASFNVTEYI